MAPGATVGLTDPVQGPLPSAGRLRVGCRAGDWLEGGQSSVRGLRACLGLALGWALIPGGGLPEAPLPRRNTHTSGNYKSKQGPHVGTKAQGRGAIQHAWPGGTPESVQTSRGGAGGQAPGKGRDSWRQPGVLPDVPGGPGHSWGARGQRRGQHGAADKPPPDPSLGPLSTTFSNSCPSPHPPGLHVDGNPFAKERLGLPSWRWCVFGGGGHFCSSSRVRVLAWLGGVGYRHFIWVRGRSS